MISTLDLWYPNYRNNPGIVSKELKLQISELLTHFEVELGQGIFEGYERYILEINYSDSDYIPYIRRLLHQTYGRFYSVDELSVGDEVRARLISPGKVGFGIFADIGIRQGSKQIDILLPLYQLRQDLEHPDYSTRELVRSLGLIDGLPVSVVIEEIEYTPKTKVTGSLSQTFIDYLLNLAETPYERIFVTKTLQSSVQRALKSAQVQKYIDRVEAIDPLTSIVTCRKQTRASGIIPRLGAQLTNIPLGIFYPDVITHK